MKSTLDSAMALHKSLLEGATKNNASVNFLENMKSQGRSPQEQSSNAFLSGMQAADQEKYDRVRDWLMDVNQKATEKRMIYENRMLAQQSITPQIMAYMQSATKMDPVTRKMFAQQIMEDWNRDTGEQGQVLAIDATNPFLVTLQGPQGTQLVDLRALVRDDPIMQRELAMQMPAYLEQQRYDRNMDQQQLGLKQQHLNLEREKLDLARNPQQQTVQLKDGEVPLSAIHEGRQKSFIEDANRLISRVPKNEAILSIVGQMKEIFNRNRNISTDITNMFDSDENTFMSILGRKFADPKKLADIQLLRKLSNDLVAQQIEGISAKTATDFFKQLIAGSKPRKELLRDSFNTIAGRFERQAQEEINQAGQLDDMILRGAYRPVLQSQHASSSEQPMQGLASSSTAAGTIRMRAPDGSERDVPLDKVEYFEKKGAVRVS